MSYLDELKENREQYIEGMNKKSDTDILTFGEAYYFCLKHYEQGGDSFVECCSPRDYDKVEKWGDDEFRIWGNTKKDLLKEMAIYEDVRTDMMGY